MSSIIKKELNNGNYGIGKAAVAALYNQIGLNARLKIVNVTNKKTNPISNFITNATANGAKKVKIAKQIRALIKTRAYKGLRHQGKLPVRGQRTHTNGKTVKRLSKVREALKKSNEANNKKKTTKTTKATKTTNKK